MDEVSRALSNGSVWWASIHDLQMAFLNSGVKKKCHIVTVYKKQIRNGSANYLMIFKR
jgi:hypothetical protein